VICFYFAQQILDILVHPLALAFPAGQGKLIYTKLYSAFSSTSRFRFSRRSC
jgi:sec-independent protein translocase protein TatC